MVLGGLGAPLQCRGVSSWWRWESRLSLPQGAGVASSRAGPRRRCSLSLRSILPQGEPHGNDYEGAEVRKEDLEKGSTVSWTGWGGSCSDALMLESRRGPLPPPSSLSPVSPAHSQL